MKARLVVRPLLQLDTHLQTHFYGEHKGKNIVEDVQNSALERPRRDVGPFHGESDAVRGNEDQNDEVEPGLFR